MGAYHYSSFLLSQTNRIINQVFLVTEPSNFAQSQSLFFSPLLVVFHQDSDIFHLSHYLSKRIKGWDIFHNRFCRFIMSCSVVGSMGMALEKSGGNAQHEKRDSLDFAETELKLGLPGVAADESRAHQKSCGKRSFSEAMESRSYTITDEDITRTGTPEDADKFHGPIVKEKQMALPANDPATTGSRPPPKAQIVGWPPVKDFRKVRTISTCDSLYVKVSMDGAPYLRKVNLKIYSTYHDLSSALENMFSCLLTMGKSRSHGLNESSLMDMPNGSGYVPTYEDKDGDWMLVGDVPWQMFVDSCQRMRIMKASEAIGLAPRTMEKCKKRN